MVDGVRTSVPPAAVPGEPGDRGFTLIVVLVSLFMVSIVMASTTAFFVRAMAVTHKEGENQSATQLATDAMERMRGLTALLPTVAQTIVRNG